MVIQFTTITEEVQGPDIEMDCPACGKEKMQAQTFESTEQVKLFFFIPILKLRNTWVQCSGCGKKLTSTLPLKDLVEQPPTGMRTAIRYGASGFAKLLSIVALLFCWAPFAGLILGGLAAFLTRGTKGWPKALSLLGLVVGVVSTAVTVIVMCIPE